jgi:hypothetical protein
MSKLIRADRHWLRGLWSAAIETKKAHISRGFVSGIDHRQWWGNLVARRRHRSATKLRRSLVSARLSFEQIELHRSSRRAWLRHQLRAEHLATAKRRIRTAGASRAGVTWYEARYAPTPFLLSRASPSPRCGITAWQELIVQSLDLVRLTGRDIVLMQRPQLIPGGLVIDPVVDWPRPLMKRRRILGNTRLCQDWQRRNQRARADNFV